MSNNKNNEERFSLLIEDFLEDLLAMSDAEVLAEATEDCKNLDAELSKIRSEIQFAIISVAKDRLSNARLAMARQRSRRLIEKIDPEEAKNLFDKFLASESGRSRLTIAARKGTRSSTSDIVSAFSDLCYLQGCAHDSHKMNFGNAPKAEQILNSLGISEPSEIDVEAIAWHLNAEVRYDKLEQCEARIVGTDNVAMITVNKNASPQRQRFSICHELGHWIYHRRRMLACDGDEIERPSAGAVSMERAADRFAAELLMPSYLFVPIARSLGRPSMHVVQKLSEIFNTSQTATAIRLVELSQLPILLACHGRSGRRWFTRSQTVTSDWMPSTDLNPESSAFSMIFGEAPNSMPPKSVSASNWFGRRNASQYEIVEESLRTTTNEVLILLAFKDTRGFLRDASVGP